MKFLLSAGKLQCGHLPVVFSMVFTTMLGITYCVGVYRTDVDPVFPYISASGDKRPESCLFGLLLNVCAILSLLIVDLRYTLVAELDRQQNPFLIRLNNLALYVGRCAACSMLIIANFQETAVIVIHLSGAFVCFGGGCLYMLLQSWISFTMVPLYGGRRVAYVRAVIAAVGVCAFFSAVSFGVLASSTFHRAHPDEPTPRPWNHKKHHEGYALHCVSAFAEWTLAIAHTLFLLSYSRDFEKINVRLHVEPLVAHLDHSPVFGSTYSVERE